MDRVAGVVEVWRTDDTHEIVIHHPALKPNASGAAQIVFSPRNARHLAHLLMEHAAEAEAEATKENPNAGLSGD
jgi:predicted Zn-dependent protease